MSKDIDICTLLSLPTELEAEANRLAVTENPANALPTGRPLTADLVALTTKLWRPGQRLKVGFLDGDRASQEYVLNTAREWMNHANISFEQAPPHDSQIRIAFDLPVGAGANSHYGTDALAVARHLPTTRFPKNFASSSLEQRRRWVLHEFGHALGCGHEHQNPKGNIPWNKQAVYKYYASPPHKWSKEAVDVGIFQKYSASITRASELDRNSIMIYAIPKELTDGAFNVDWNTTLSSMDKQYIRRLYPRVYSLTLNGPSPGWVDTKLSINSGDIITVRAEGKIRFFGGSYERDPDGRDEDGRVEEPAWRFDNALGKHPAPNHRKNSVVFRVNSWTFQGGTSVTVESRETGRLLMTSNDNVTSDNQGHWSIEILIS